MTPKGKGKSPSRHGKGKYGDRGWKSHNFPAGYQSDQVTPALHEETSSTADPAWWDEHELSSVIMGSDEDPHVPLQPIFSLDDADEDDVAEYIDLIILAIVTNMTRHTTYLLNPSTRLRRDILQHDVYISTAEACTNVHIQRIIRTFKTSIFYDAAIALMHC